MDAHVDAVHNRPRAEPFCDALDVDDGFGIFHGAGSEEKGSRLGVWVEAGRRRGVMADVHGLTGAQLGAELWWENGLDEVDELGPGIAAVDDRRGEFGLG